MSETFIIAVETTSNHWHMSACHNYSLVKYHPPTTTWYHMYNLNLLRINVMLVMMVAVTAITALSSSIYNHLISRITHYRFLWLNIYSWLRWHVTGLHARINLLLHGGILVRIVWNLHLLGRHGRLWLRIHFSLQLLSEKMICVIILASIQWLIVIVVIVVIHS